MSMQEINLEQESTQVKSASYNKETGLLRIQFQRGGVYEYEGVPENIVQTMVHAPSIGRYFAMAIKGQYPTYRIDPGKRTKV